MGSVFAPNHKGMPVLEKDSRNGFMRDQATTSRNVFPHPLTDFIYGGLNYQIEHHLFPNMPRKNFNKARQVVKEFCLARSIPYHETSVLGSPTGDSGIPAPGERTVAKESSLRARRNLSR